MKQENRGTAYAEAPLFSKSPAVILVAPARVASTRLAAFDL
jgi:hypothetical protein